MQDTQAQIDEARQKVAECDAKINEKDLEVQNAQDRQKELEQQREPFEAAIKEIDARFRKNEGELKTLQVNIPLKPKLLIPRTTTPSVSEALPK